MKPEWTFLSGGKVWKIYFLLPWNDKIQSRKKASDAISLIFCGLMIYSHVLGFLCVLSLTWLAYATLNYSSSCYLPVTSLCCCVLVCLEKQGFPTVKSLNNGGITKWPTGRCQSSLGFLSSGENGRPSAVMYYLIKIAHACSHMPKIISMKCSLLFLGHRISIQISE